MINSLIFTNNGNPRLWVVILGFGIAIFCAFDVWEHIKNWRLKKFAKKLLRQIEKELFDDYPHDN